MLDSHQPFDVPNKAMLAWLTCQDLDGCNKNISRIEDTRDNYREVELAHYCECKAVQHSGKPWEEAIQACPFRVNVHDMLLVS